MACETFLAADLERPRDYQELARRRRASYYLFLFAGIVAKSVDDIGFPIKGSIIDIARV